MAISIVMPALEMAQETGKLVSWIKPEGATVAKGEPILEIETDKAVMEIESPAAGVLAGIKAHPGDVVPVGQIIAWIVGPGEVPPAEETQATSGRRLSLVAAPAITPAAQTPEAQTTSSATAPETHEIRISPKARRLAKERGVDLSRLRGSGSDGEITTADVLAQANAPSSAVPVTSPATSAPMTSIARLMAERTTQSWTTVPHFFVTREVDAGALNILREQLLPGIERTHGVRLTHTDLLVALVARVLARYRIMNASWAGGQIRMNPDVNIAIAMAVGEGVVGAVIPKADVVALSDIAVQRRDLSERARAGRLRPADIAGATFTISNLGMYRVDSFTAIITPPQAAILAVGSITDRVVPVDGQPGIRPILNLTLSSDHRVVDGARAADFLDALAEAIREPKKLLS
jgi:pyruvate dehydrogenase E2 component (dihydrolipoamide acetyltransferase)